MAISRKSRLKQFLKRDPASFFESWLMRRQRPQRSPIRLERQRIYILPTGYGYLYALMLLVMFLWAINYNNSMGFGMTFLLGAVALNAIWRTHANLLNLQVCPLGAEAVFAGQNACFTYHIDNLADHIRYGIALQGPETPLQFADIPAMGSARFELMIPAKRRGLLRPGRLRLLTRFPLGLFKAWSWLEFEQACIVYPRPQGKRPLPQRSAGSTGGRVGGSVIGSDDFAGMRNYVPGDSPRHIAWKATIGGDELLVKRFIEQIRFEVWLEWCLLAPDPVETRLAQLCQWVLKAETEGMEYGLRLPGKELPPGRGTEHRRRCLETLALHVVE